MTHDELRVLSDLFIARSAGLVGAVQDEYAAEAERLAEAGWLERRWHEGDLVYGFTDTGLGAMELAGLHRTDEADQN